MHISWDANGFDTVTRPPHETGMSVHTPHLVAMRAPTLALITAIALASLLGLRILALFLDPNVLYADETQYWLWSQNPDWGYFSKPPMVAWLIAVTTAVFGDADWAVRLSAPVLHTMTATLLGLTAARLFDARTGAWTAITWATLPSVWLSSVIISTDAVMLTGVSAALYALVRLREGPDWRFALVLGAATGYAFLSKYTAVYLLIGLGLSGIVDAPVRRALVSVQGMAALVLFGALASGNLVWNAAHDFATLSHTAANANWNPETLFRAHKMRDFLVGQLGIVGPVLFPILIWVMARSFRTLGIDVTAARPQLMLTLFVAPVLLTVTIQSFISRAHANWAAVAYAAGLILIVGFLMEGKRWRRWILFVSVGLHSAIGLAFLALACSTTLTDAAGLSNAFKRVRGWPETVQAVERAAREANVATIVYDNRNDFHQMQRYGETRNLAMFMWMRYPYPQNFAEQNWPLLPGYDEPVLIVSERPREVPIMARNFNRFEPAGNIVIELGGNRKRRYNLYLAQGFMMLDQNKDREVRTLTGPED